MNGNDGHRSQAIRDVIVLGGWFFIALGLTLWQSHEPKSQLAELLSDIVPSVVPRYWFGVVAVVVSLGLYALSRRHRGESKSISLIIETVLDFSGGLCALVAGWIVGAILLQLTSCFAYWPEALAIAGLALCIFGTPVASLLQLRWLYRNYDKNVSRDRRNVIRVAAGYIGPIALVLSVVGLVGLVVEGSQPRKQRPAGVTPEFDRCGHPITRDKSADCRANE